jgi:hypothetical protein
MALALDNSVEASAIIHYSAGAAVLHTAAIGPLGTEEMPMADEKKPLKADKLIQKLVSDPATPPDVTVIKGFLGESHRPGYWRLYLSPDLKSYVEIAESDILHSQEVSENQSALGGTLLWVKKGASLEHTRTVSKQVQAEFLSGDVAASATAARGYTSPRVKYDSVNLCPTDVGPCASDVRCPTASWRFCPTEACPTGTCPSGLCETSSPLFCPQTYQWQLC